MVDKYNAGDVAEGIFTLACVTRFIVRDEKIKQSDMQAVLDTVIAAKGRTTQDTLKCSWLAPNLNPSIKDKINLTIRLAASNMNALLHENIFSQQNIKPIVAASLHYVNSETLTNTANLIYTNNQENVLDFVADGIGDQKGTKRDMFVKIIGPNGKSELNLSISLKAGDVKQFGQIGGSQPEKQQALWEQFGFDMPTGILNKYSKLYAAGKLNDAIVCSYTELAKTISSAHNYNASGKSIPRKTLKASIIHFMIGKEEDIELVQLNRESKIYNPNKLEFPKPITAKLKPSGAWPEIIIETKDLKNKTVDVLRIRTKIENRTQYIRNYIEKGPDLHSMQTGL